MSQNKFSAIFARVFSEQVGVLKIRFVSYIKETLTYSVQEAIAGVTVLHFIITHILSSESTLR